MVRHRNPSGNRFTRALLAVSLMAILSITPTVAQDELDDPIHRYTAIPDQQLDNEQRLTLSRAAGLLLRHVNSARQSLAGTLALVADSNFYDDPFFDAALVEETADVALAELRQALVLTDIIETLLPQYSVSTVITLDDEGLEYSDETVVQPMLVDVYSELHVAEILGPVLRTRQPPGQQPTRVTLNVRLAKVEIERAQRHLSRRNLELADAALATVQNDVILRFIDNNVPLRMARVNLWRVEEALAADRRDDARFYLASVLDSLANYRDQVGEERAKDVEALSREALALYSNLVDELSGQAQEQRLPPIEKEAARQLVTGWWHRVTSWF